MKRSLFLLLTVAVLFVNSFGKFTHAAIGQCDFSSAKDGDVDGSDLAQFAAYYAAVHANADVNGDSSVDSNDVAHFAEFFGQTYNVSARPPNILLIISDDVGLDVTTDMYPGLIDELETIYSSHPGVGNIRGTPASTPVLDHLAQEGKVFSNAWAQPFCSPTRASIITGLFANKHDVITYQDPLSQNHASFVKKLRDEAGYSTAAFGKWHLAGLGTYTGMKPKQAGFDLFKGSRGAALSSYWAPYEYYVQTDSTPDNVWNPGTLQPRTLPGITATTYAPVVKGWDTIDWINTRQAADPNKPWFAYLAFNMSHATAGSPMMVVPDKDTLDCHATDPLQDGPACKEIKGCGGTFGGTSIGSCTGEQLMRAMTASMDTVIGKVLEAVDSIPSDTYVIYTGDNGTPMYTIGGSLGPQIGNMYITRTGRGKGTAYESGARVAMAIRGPGIAGGSKSSEFVHAADLFSTILELAGLTPPENVPNYAGSSVPLDSVSLAPILFGPSSTVRDPNEGYILTESQNLMTAGQPIVVGARNGTYKVNCINNTNTGNCTFYNLITDPLEEFPLDKPISCTGWTTANPEWHYCRLIEVITTYSIF
jgi:arylsulfatase A-like enzyme